MKRLVLLLFLSQMFQCINSQDISVPARSFPRFNVGAGAGLDYGGVGGRFTLLPQENLGVFGAVGYNTNDVGLNAGVSFRALPYSDFCPYLGVMYGYNTVLVIEYGDDRTYYGPSYFLGSEIWLKKWPLFFNVELVVPVRSKEFQNDLKTLRSNPALEYIDDLPPVGISLGLHMAF